jgi:hypothetical protein
MDERRRRRRRFGKAMVGGRWLLVSLVLTACGL